MQVIPGGTYPLCGPSLEDFDFQASAAPRDTIVDPGSVESSTVHASIYDSHTGASYDTGAQIICSQIVGPATPFSFASLDTGIATVDDNGMVSRVADGAARILVTGGSVTRRVQVATSHTVGGMTTVLVDFVDGSLAKHCHEALSALLIGGKQKNIFSTLNNSASLYVRNPNFWGHGLDLTPLSVYQSYGSVQRAATLITRKHYIQAEHWQTPVGQTIRWVAQDGTVHNRTVAAKLRISKDLLVGTLDSELPESIGCVQLFPANYRNKLSTLGTESANGTTIYLTDLLPGFAPNQSNTTTMMQLRSTGYNVAGAYWSFNGVYPVLSPYTDANWNTAVIGGDSGSAFCFLINGRLVVGCTWWGAGGGIDFSQYLAAINAYCSPYSVVTADLSSFPDYSS
jgi:hypothetical protein